MKKINLTFIALVFTISLIAQNTESFRDQNHITSIFEIMKDKSLSLDEVKEYAKKYFDNDNENVQRERKHYDRWLYERKFHSDENGYVISLSKEQEKYNSFSSYNQNRAINVGNWTNDGPFGWNATTGWNPGNGRLMDVAVHPSRTGVMVVGSPDGGLWRSGDGGNSWSPRSDNNADRMNIRSVAVSLSNQDVFYAGTRDGVILKSVNSGYNWIKISTNNAGPKGEIRKIIVDPIEEEKVFVVAENGIWKTYNSGNNWYHRLETTSQMDDIEFKPTQNWIMYASGYSGFYKSEDWGNTWSLFNAIPTGRRTKIAVSPNNPNAVYLIQAKTDNRTFDKLYLSTDAGNLFSIKYRRSSNGGNNLFGFTQDHTGGQSFIHMGITVNPNNWRDVHVAGLVTFRSRNAGSSFSQTSEWKYTNNQLGYTHSDVTQLQYVGNTIYITTDGGLYKSTNNGNNWTDISNGLSIRTAYKMGSSRTNKDVYAAGFQDTGSVVHDSSGFRDWLGADGGEILIHPTNTNRLYGSSQYGSTYYSGDRGNGNRKNLANLDGQFIMPWVIGSTLNPSTGHPVLYAGTNNGIEESTNGGTSYFKISPGSGSAALSGAPQALALSPQNSNYIYASVGSTLYHSHNGGANWYKYTATQLLSQGNITDIKVHPNDKAQIYFTTDNNSTSGGRIFSFNVISWDRQNISGNLPKFAFRSLVIDHSSPYRIYAAGNIGIYATDNNGDSWTDISSNLPKVAIREIDLQYSEHKLRVATYGRGIWEYSVTGDNKSFQTNTAGMMSENNKDLIVYPNPATDKITVDISEIDNASSIIVMASSGITRKRIDNINAGTKQILVDVSDLNSGVYILHIMSDSDISKSVNFIKK